MRPVRRAGWYVSVVREVRDTSCLWARNTAREVLGEPQCWRARCCAFLTHERRLCSARIVRACIAGAGFVEAVGVTAGAAGMGPGCKATAGTVIDDAPSSTSIAHPTSPKRTFYFSALQGGR